MKESDFLSAENDPELYRIVSIYKEMLRTGKITYLEDYELNDLATFYYDNDDDENLKQVLELADGLHPDSDEILYIKTRFLLKQGDFEKANKSIEKMKEAESSFTQKEDAYYQIEMGFNIKMLEGEMALMQNFPEKADEYFQEAFDIAQDNEDKSYVAINAAAMYLVRNMDEETIKWIERSIEYSPGNQPALELLSYYYTNRNDVKKAEKVLSQLVDEDPYSTHYWKLTGNTYLNNNDFEKAIEAYDFALAIDVDDYEALKRKAIAFINLENYEKGHQLLSDYLKKVPDDYNALALDALCMTNMGEYAESAKLLEIIMQKTDNGRNDQTIHQIELFHLIVRTYRIAMKFDKAMEWTEKALEYGLETTFYTIMKGALYMEVFMEKEANKYFNKAIAEAENKLYAMYLVASEFFFFQEYASCKKWLLEVYKQSGEKEYPNVLGMLAYSYLNLEKYNKYLQFLKEGYLAAPAETETIFSEMIPEEMSLEDFYLSEKSKYQ